MSAPAFLSAHAAHADWRQALSSCTLQLHEQVQDVSGDSRPGRGNASGPTEAFTLGFCYLTDYYAAEASAICQALRQQWPQVQWVGCVGVGVAAGGVEHMDEPGMALMLTTLSRSAFRVFSGRHPLSEGGDFAAHTALIHADGRTQDLGELLDEMSRRVATGYLFGGLASSRTRLLHIADEPFEGGLSGVAFSDAVQLVSRVTQGCQPVGLARRITEAENNLVISLDGESPLSCLVRDLGAAADEPLARLAMRLSHTLVGLSEPGEDTLERPGQFGADVRVRHLIGLEPNRGYLSVAEPIRPGMLMTFCKRDPEAARRDLTRIATEIREVVEGDAEAGSDRPARRIAGAIYVSCSGRGGEHFGAPNAELQIVRRALGDLPLVGFFAGGEIARNHLYGYTGVLTAFTVPA